MVRSETHTEFYGEGGDRLWRRIQFEIETTDFCEVSNRWSLSRGTITGYNVFPSHIGSDDPVALNRRVDANLSERARPALGLVYYSCTRSCSPKERSDKK